jgi:2-methylcitrate dehydratase PrpD
VLFDRELWMDQFEPARFNDPEVRRFALERVELISDAALKGVQAIVELDIKDGTTLTARCHEPKGTPENRMTRAEIEAKFRKGAKGRLGTAQVESVLDTISHLEELPSVRALMDILRAEKS